MLRLIERHPYSSALLAFAAVLVMAELTVVDLLPSSASDVAADKSDTASVANATSNDAEDSVSIRAVAPPPDASTWPLPRGNAEATGVAAGPLPDHLDLLWSHKLDKGWFEATAVIDDGAVYVGSSSGPMLAFALADGAPKWEFPTKYGFLAPAALRDDRLYAGDCDGRFYCLDAATGEERWHFDASAEIDNACNFYKDRLVFGSQDGGLYCLNTADGALVWTLKLQDQIRCLPTIVSNRVFVAGCDGALHIVDLDNGEEVAKVELSAPTGSTPAVMGDLLFAGTEGNTFFAIDWKRAKIVWSYESPIRPQPFRTASVTPEAVYAGSQDKRLHAVNPHNGEPIWDFPTSGSIEGAPLVVGSRVFLGSNDGTLYAVDRKSGEAVWTYETDGHLIASPAVAAGRLVIGSDRGTLYCFGNKTP